MNDATLAELAEHLTRAQEAAAAAAGRLPTGLRVVEPAPGHRWVLCAFDGPAFLCLDEKHQAEQSEEAVRRAAICALLVEQVESLVDAEELTLVAGICDRVASSDREGSLGEVLRDVARGARELEQWRRAPGRVVAAVAEIDHGVACHERVRRHYERFLELSEPLVAVQDTLPGDLVDALRDLDAAASRAGLTTALPVAVAGAFEGVEAGADEMIAAHLTPLTAGS